MLGVAIDSQSRGPSLLVLYNADHPGSISSVQAAEAEPTLESPD